MPEEAIGKIFYTPEEAAARGKMPTPEQKAAAQAALDQWNATLRTAPPPTPTHAAPIGGQFSDDYVGTEKSGWRPGDPVPDQDHTPGAGDDA